MSTRIFIDQENEASSTQPAKDLVKPSSDRKPAVRSHKSKAFASGSGVKTPRKALGNVNKQTTNQKTVQPMKGILNMKKHVPAAKKLSEKCPKVEKQVYPEIEKFEPYNPADFETFDVPEDHKLSHLSMAGMGLLVNPNYVKKLETLLGIEPAPIEIPALSWESGADYNFPNFYAAFEMIMVEMPVKY
ncbi:securin-like isoform X2 [Hyla sarda]|uniref:securin-like isoform X2 n=1 Tax=Hyla sarda TaxID=327740 RepID=UPI0024C2A59A|nr:securin-like isoform X2 [Hyla sarda]XP_056372658.1 securin-like isoform X2 [Hyla sarda]XP_056372659.1 securin-like isoform X2 [Hyla sarda]XP_056372660.1 securin-like isoform X2 [Hyla sarda]XP_056372662.1 securin-like isoform X2 [Hyla sarda]